MCEEPVHWGLLIDLPNTNTLIVGAAGHQLIIVRDNNIADPFLVPMIRSRVKASTDFPKFDGLVSGAGNQIIPIEYEIHKAYVVIMSNKSLAANVIIIQIPEFY